MACKKIYLGQEHPPHNYKEHLATLNVYTSPTPGLLTGIICTIGRSCARVEKIPDMILMGMNIARINLWQEKEDDLKKIIQYIRDAETQIIAETKIPYGVGIAMDMEGRDLHTGCFGKKAGVDLKEGSKVTFSVEENLIDNSTEASMYISVPEVLPLVTENMRVFLDFGAVELQVASVDEKTMSCKVMNNGFVQNQAGINIPGIDIDIPIISEKDKCNLKISVENGVELIMASYVRCAEDFNTITEVLDTNAKGRLRVFAKIECCEGIKNIDEIIKAFDGIVICRGDLGIELPSEKVPIIQKHIIARCKLAGKPVIVGTHLLESMKSKPRPTRSEITDVMNAVDDGADSLMLVNETSIGCYALETIVMLTKLCRESEYNQLGKQRYQSLTFKMPVPASILNSFGAAVVQAAFTCCATAILVLTTSGTSAFCISRYNPPCPVITVTRNISLARVGWVHRAIWPIWYSEELLPEWLEDVKLRIRVGIHIGMCEHFIKAGDKVIVATGWRPGPGHTDTMRIVTVTQDATKITLNLLTDKLPEWLEDVKLRIRVGIHFGMCEHFIKAGDKVIVATGWRPGLGHTDTMRIVTVTQDATKITL